MNIGGALVSSVLKIAVTAAVLVLAYLLIIKPILNTTESITNNTNSSIQQSLNQAFGFEAGSPTARKIKREVGNGKGFDEKALINCIERSSQSAAAAQRCVKKFGP